MTGIEDLRQVARIARSEGWALDILIRRLACLLSKNEWHWADSLRYLVTTPQ